MAARAGRQWGVVTWDHLREDGFDGAAVRRRVGSGALVRRHRGVYVVGHVPLSPEGEELAAVYAAGGDAVLSELSGAVRMGMLRFRGRRIDVTTGARGRRRPIDGVDLHHTRSLPDPDRTTHLGIPIATVPRILLDLAGRPDISDRALESAAAQAERDGRLDRDAQLALARRSQGWVGGARLRAALHAGPDLLLSEEEHGARELMVTAGLPVPEANVVIPSDAGPLMCDLWWPAYGYVLEVHGGQHGRFLNATRDVVRDGAHRRAGRRVDAVTARAVREHPATVVAVAVAGLRARGWDG